MEWSQPDASAHFPERETEASPRDRHPVVTEEPEALLCEVSDPVTPPPSPTAAARANPRWGCRWSPAASHGRSQPWSCLSVPRPLGTPLHPPDSKSSWTLLLFSLLPDAPPSTAEVLSANPLPQAFLGDQGSTHLRPGLRSRLRACLLSTGWGSGWLWAPSFPSGPSLSDSIEGLFLSSLQLWRCQQGQHGGCGTRSSQLLAHREVT